MNTVRIDSKQTRMVAHRGVSGLERENTQLAFVAAGNRSYWGVETDVRTTADGHFIILHDDDTARVAGGVALKPEESNLTDLRALTLLEKDGSAGHAYLRLPTLEEYISVCKKYEKKCVLELKTPMNEAQTADMIARIRSLDYLEHVTFISFLFEDLVLVKKLVPEQKAQFLFGEITDEQFEEMKRHGMDVDIYYRKLTPELLKKFHNAGMEVNCWTVDDPADAARLVEWGVDYITSNILE